MEHTNPLDTVHAMRAEVVDWVESSLGASLAGVVELSGGLTSTMLALTDSQGQQAVLRLMTKEPWRAHGPALTRRERAAQQELRSTAVPAPTSIALDADGSVAGTSMHLMSKLSGVATTHVDDMVLDAMARMLDRVHQVRPVEPFRAFQSWAWPAKWVVPSWSAHPDSWRKAFEILAVDPPPYRPAFLHRDFSHRNLLWSAGKISGVVDWVETSTGPVWLDAAHAATNLALAFGREPARYFLSSYARLAPEEPHRYWLVMDAVGFLEPPGRAPHFGTPSELKRLDQWLHELTSSHDI